MKILSGFPLKEDYLELYRSDLYNEIISYINNCLSLLQIRSSNLDTDPIWYIIWEIVYVLDRISVQFRTGKSLQNRSVCQTIFLDRSDLDSEYRSDPALSHRTDLVKNARTDLENIHRTDLDNIQDRSKLGSGSELDIKRDSSLDFEKDSETILYDTVVVHSPYTINKEDPSLITPKIRSGSSNLEKAKNDLSNLTNNNQFQVQNQAKNPRQNPTDPICINRTNNNLEPIWDRNNHNIKDIIQYIISYVIKSKYPQLDINITSNKNNTDLIWKLNKGNNTLINYTIQDYKFLGYNYEEFDLIYSLSINKGINIKKFKQLIFRYWGLLKPYGRLILTFNINDLDKDIIWFKELDNVITGKFYYEVIPNYVLTGNVVNEKWINNKMESGSKKNRTINYKTIYCITLIRLGDRED